VLFRYNPIHGRCKQKQIRSTEDICQDTGISLLASHKWRNRSTITCKFIIYYNLSFRICKNMKLIYKINIDWVSTRVRYVGLNVVVILPQIWNNSSLLSIDALEASDVLLSPMHQLNHHSKNRFQLISIRCGTMPLKSIKIGSKLSNSPKY
jgi:hypothetical protein